ncbi:hypothetical protein ACJMK2_036116 [Sinanodonta woodiana]|uniref:GRIP domain-containing protein n=1 Tax=Sinanodonta woodiana TaxID=1069815 RepID=A0ABD3WG77_SINWO
MDRAKCIELLKTIEVQKDQIQRYESRLRDLVQAYKGVMKEKEALESSMKVLSLAQKKPKKRVTWEDSPNETESDVGSTQDKKISDPLTQPQDAYQATSELESLQEQVKTLSSSLLTVTEEKSKLESSLLADKKRLMQENEELRSKLEEVNQKLLIQEKDFQSQIQEMKSKIRLQQHEREKEQTDHALMLRELQKLLASEREAKERFEHQYDEVQFQMKEKEGMALDNTRQYKAQIESLKHDLLAANKKVTDLEEKATQLSPHVLELQREVAELKAQHRLQVQTEQNKASDVENMIKDFSLQSETRVSELEAKLSELSEVIGNYERMRYQDQQTIVRLKERVNQLDLENTALAQAAQSSGYIMEEPDHELEKLDSSTLAAKIVKLKGFLKLANQKAQQPVNIEDLLMDEKEGDEEHPLCRKYREELEQLQDEFERYKLRAQSVLKNKTSKENTSSKETDLLKDQVSDLREKMKNLHLQLDEERDQHAQREENLRKTLLSVQEKHRQEVSQIHGEHHTQIQEMEDELKKQRDRTISMLAEKDRELEIFRATSSHRLDTDYVLRYRQNQDFGAASSDLLRQNSEEEALARLLNPPTTGQGEITLLYFAQEQARKDVEIGNLRKQKRELEGALRELQLSSCTKEENLYEEIENLKEEIRKSERSRNREGANLEYLKNVMYKFLICHDVAGKQQMLNAITTILQFSPQEKSTVQTYTRSWWIKK